VGASLLQAVGHPEWLARDWDDYVMKAAACASDQAGRAGLRLRLREEMRASALLDHAGQAARFGAALREIWGRYCRSQLQTEARKVA
jgi:protein O-GlcNAc transferase